MKIRIAGLQNIFAARKFAQDGILGGKLRCQVVRGARICIADFLVALLTSRVSQKVTASGRSSFVDGCCGVARMDGFSVLWCRRCPACSTESSCASQHYDYVDELHCRRGNSISLDTLADIAFALNANTDRLLRGAPRPARNGHAEKLTGLAAEELQREAIRYLRRCLILANATSQFNFAVRGCDIVCSSTVLGLDEFLA